MSKHTSNSTAVGVQVTTVTPELAERWLGKNVHNRNIRQRVVNAYANDMRDGNWILNGESIKFACDGVLIDGQHRLSAVIQAEVSAEMLVVTGLTDLSQETVDGGAKRKFSDVLALRGEVSPITLAAIVRLVTQWEMQPGQIGGSNISPTNLQMLETLERHPHLREGVSTANRVRTNASLPASVAGFAWWLFTQIDADDAEGFFSTLITGESIAKGDPVYTLRAALKAIDGVRGAKNTRYLAAITIKAWNFYRAGEQCFQLKFRPGGANPTRFPEPK